MSLSELYTFGYDIKGREHLDHWNNSVLLLHPADTFNHSGHVHSWHFFANRTVNVTLQVWRPVATSSVHQFKLVGQNFFNISSTGIQNVVVSPGDRIPFEEGDVIGVYFPSLNPIPFSKRTSSCSAPILYLHMTRPKLRKTYPFRERQDGWNPCRVYSIHLQISNTSEYLSHKLSPTEKNIPFQEMYSKILSHLCFMYQNMETRHSYVSTVTPQQGTSRVLMLCKAILLWCDQGISRGRCQCTRAQHETLSWSCLKCSVESTLSITMTTSSESQLRVRVPTSVSVDQGSGQGGPTGTGRSDFGLG